MVDGEFVNEEFTLAFVIESGLGGWGRGLIQDSLEHFSSKSSGVEKMHKVPPHYCVYSMYACTDAKVHHTTS